MKVFLYFEGCTTCVCEDAEHPYGKGGQDCSVQGKRRRCWLTMHQEVTREGPNRRIVDLSSEHQVLKLNEELVILFKRFSASLCLES